MICVIASSSDSACHASQKLIRHRSHVVSGNEKSSSGGVLAHRCQELGL